jgi:3-oxoacyl-[acyl-carrier protein] reductase
MPAFFRHDLGFGTADDVAGLIAYLASDEAAGITGQAIGAGGDRLQVWTHPEPATTDYREGGWTYEALQERGAEIIGGHLQSVGEEFLPLPENLQPAPAEAH